MKNRNVSIGNQTRDLPICSRVPPRAPTVSGAVSLLPNMTSWVGQLQSRVPKVSGVIALLPNMTSWFGQLQSRVPTVSGAVSLLPNMT